MALQPPIIVTMGEPAGIGPEVILKAWLQRREKALPAFAVLGDADFLAGTASGLGLDVPVQECSAGDAPARFPDTLPVLPCAGAVSAQAGKPSKSDATLITGWIESGVAMVMEGAGSALVTAPINKHALYGAGFEHPGHTEFLASLAERHTGGKAQAVMMLAGPQLRTVPVTIHIPLARVCEELTAELLEATIRITHHDLRQRFAIVEPVVAVAGLNPHAGESGSMGYQEMEVIVPLLDSLRAEGMRIKGPLPADTMFHASARKTYDVAICMYHDQALIPAKTLAFDEAVNVTLGLPFIRTSPDHGTALDIAGKGIARPDSMIAAIRMAGEMAGREAAARKASAGSRS